METRTFTVDGPLSLRHTLGPLRHGPDDPSIRFSSDGVWRAARTPLGPASLLLRRQARSLEAAAWGPGAEAALEQVPLLAGLDDPSRALVAEHPTVARLQRELRGLRLTRTGAVLDTLVPLVLEQGVSSFEAHRAHRQLLLAYGEPAPGPADLVVPPEPGALAAAPFYDLHVLGIEQERAGVVRRLAAGPSRLEGLAELAPPVALERLTALAGVTPRSAALAAQLALGDTDAVPLGDPELPTMVCRTLLGEDGDDARMLEALEPYRGFRARVVRLVLTAGVGRGRRPGLRSIANL